MCKTCNGQGGLAIEHKWGISFHPCPDSKCDFDRNAEQKRLLAAWSGLAAGLDRESA